MLLTLMIFCEITGVPLCDVMEQDDDSDDEGDPRRVPVALFRLDSGQDGTFSHVYYYDALFPEQIAYTIRNVVKTDNGARTDRGTQ